MTMMMMVMTMMMMVMTMMMLGTDHVARHITAQSPALSPVEPVRVLLPDDLDQLGSGGNEEEEDGIDDDVDNQQEEDDNDDDVDNQHDDGEPALL